MQKSGNRFYLNLLTAMSNNRHLVFTAAECNFSTGVYIGFLQKLLRPVKQKVFVITDRHPVRLSKQAGDWPEAKRKKMEVFYLPNYSLDLNPVEYFSQYIKNKVAGKQKDTNKAELKKAVEDFAARKKEHP